MSGFMRRFRGKRDPAEVDAILYSGKIPLEVVGESFYQDNLSRAAEVFGRQVPAVLMPEPDNEHDSNAVAVLVGGLKVGHLSRDDAALYQADVARKMSESGRLVALEGEIVGGEAGKPTFGIWLTHDPTDFGLPMPSDKSEPKPSELSARERQRRRGDQVELDPAGQPYEARFNRARRAEREISELLGLCKGFLADSELSDSEIHALSTWFERRGEGAEDWIVAQIVRRVRAILDDGVVSPTERSELLGILSAFAGGTGELVLGEDPRSTGLPLDAPAPDLHWSDSVFVFTGRFAFGPRVDCERATANLGGITEHDITTRTDYLVIGTFGSRDWVHTTYGRKIQKATQYRERGVPLAIVCEDHWRRWLS